MIHLCGLHEVDAAWPQLVEGMTEACRRGNGSATEQWLWLGCRKGDLLLVIDHDGPKINGGCVCELHDRHGETVLHLHALCGSDRRAMAAFAAAKFKVNKATFEGRKGWAREPGVRELRRVYEMDLNHGR